MNCLHCGQNDLPVETYSFNCDGPGQQSREIELELCLNCVSELRLDPELQLVSVAELDD